MTVTDTQTNLGGGVGAVFGAAGLVVAPGVDIATCPGPLLIGDITDAAGELIGVVVVTDGDDADALLIGAVEAASVELGGVGEMVEPVGGGSEVTARFAMPVTSVVWSGADGQPAAAFVTPADRRGPEPAAIPMPNQPAAGLGAVGAPSAGAGTGLDKLVNVSLEVSVELGRTTVTLAEVLNYDVGATIELDRAAGAPVDIRVNDTLLAQGEVVLIDDEYAVRITAIIDPGQAPS